MCANLAINGSSPVISSDAFTSFRSVFTWPILTDEDKAALMFVTDNLKMSAIDITKEFEKEYASWIGVDYALGYCNGTAAVQGALWACGVGAGDEVIGPSLTYWASCAPALNLGAAVNFADVDPETLCIDPDDIEHRIGERTKAIVVVHYAGYPADMDRIMAIAKKHNVKVIEDSSHSHASLYKGRYTGALGDISASSMMSSKAFAIGEAGMITTNNRELYERCISFGHYERTGVGNRARPEDQTLTNDDLIKYAGIPFGGKKDRMNQWCSAVGRVQLKHFPARVAEIDKAMNYFADGLEKIKGLKVHRPAADSGSTKGGWYFPLCHFNPEEMGISAEKFCEAVRAEGVHLASAGANAPLHLHPMFHTADIFNMGQPTMLSFGQRDVRQGKGALPVTEKVKERVITLPHFIKFDKEVIDLYISAYKKVSENIAEIK